MLSPQTQLKLSKEKSKTRKEFPQINKDSSLLPSSTVDALRAKIQESEGIPPERQTIIFAGKTLVGGKL